MFCTSWCEVLMHMMHVPPTLSHKVGRAFQFSRQFELCQTKCSLLKQHIVKVLFRSIIVSSFICSIFIAMHNTSNRNYPNYLPFAPCAVYVCVSVAACVSVRLFSVMACQYRFLNSPAR